MAERKSPLSKKEIEEGVTTEKKGVVVPIEQRMPTTPELKRMTKKQHVQWHKDIMEKRAAAQTWSEEYDKKKKEKAPVTEGPAPEKSYAVVKVGRKSAVKVFKGKDAEINAQKYIVGLPKKKQKDLSVVEK